VAEQVFGTWVWPFEALSLLLLVALIAAFAVSRMARAAEVAESELPEPAAPERISQ
jgi:hypothetical protein